MDAERLRAAREKLRAQELRWRVLTMDLPEGGRRFEVRRSEFGYNTNTTSPRRQFIAGGHFGPVPILGKQGQSTSQIGRLSLVDSALLEVDRLRRTDPYHNHAGTFGLVQRFD
jgi:hypothetical protein